MLTWVGDKGKQPDEIKDYASLVVFKAAMSKALQKFRADVEKVQPYEGRDMWWEDIRGAYATPDAGILH